MTHEEDLYLAVGGISARHAMLDDALQYFYKMTARKLGVSTIAIDEFVFSNKLDLLAKLMKRDRDLEYRLRVDTWIKSARIDNKQRNEVVHSTYAILENDKILGPTKYLQIWKAKNIRRVANLPEMRKLATRLSVLVAHLSLLLNRKIDDSEWKELMKQLAEAEGG